MSGPHFVLALGYLYLFHTHFQFPQAKGSNSPWFAVITDVSRLRGYELGSRPKLTPTACPSKAICLSEASICSRQLFKLSANVSINATLGGASRPRSTAGTNSALRRRGGWAPTATTRTGMCLRVVRANLRVDNTRSRCCSVESWTDFILHYLEGCFRIMKLITFVARLSRIEFLIIPAGLM